jgi:glycosyltransferase involved in cell wall biosynthesis
MYHRAASLSRSTACRPPLAIGGRLRTADKVCHRGLEDARYSVSRMADSPIKSTILFVIGSLAVGGAESQLVLLAHQLVKRGWQVDIFCVDDEGPLWDEALRSGVRLHSAGWNSRFPRWRRTLLLLYSQWRLIRLARRLRPDVLHCFLPLTNFMGAVAGRLAGVPKLITSRRALGNHQTRHPLWRYADRIANHLSTHILANSQAVSADTLARDRPAPAKLSVIYNGIDTLPFRNAPSERDSVRERLGLDRDHILIGAVGNLIPYKGHADLIAAFALAGAGDARLTLAIAGQDRGIGKDLMQQAETLGVADRVALLGRRDDVPALLGAFDLAVLPSHEEGFSNALLEMLAAGLPVIATRVGGNAEAMTGMDGCVLVPPGDPAALGAALRAIIASLPQDPTLAVRRRALIEERYSVAAMVANHERIYRAEPPAAGSLPEPECLR